MVAVTRTVNNAIRPTAISCSRQEHSYGATMLEPTG
jgi:hypothetical protein